MSSRKHKRARALARAAAQAAAPPPLVEPPQPPWLRPVRQVVLPLAVVVLAALAVTVNSLPNEFILDDLERVQNNDYLRASDHLLERLIFKPPPGPGSQRNDPSRPLVYLTYTLVFRAAGASPWAFRLVNVAVHALAGVLVFLVAAATAARLRGRRAAVGPLVVALLFVVTPIQVGTATYVYGLSDTLSALLVLASLYLFARTERPGWVGRVLSGGLFALALAAKQSAIVLPALVLLHDAAVGGPQVLRRLRARWRLHLPYWIIALGYLAARAAFFDSVGDLEGGGQTIPTMPYLLHQPAVIARYLRLTLVPRGLALDHALGPEDFGWLELWGAGLGLVVLVLVAVRLLARWSPHRALAALGIGVFLLALAPTSSVLPTVDIMVERRVYFANLGVFLLIGLLVYDPEGPVAARLGRVWPALLAVAALQLGAGGVLAARRTLDFRTTRSGYEATLAIYPRNTRALNGVATAAFAAGDQETARALYERVLAVAPGDASALFNLGTMYQIRSPRRNLETALAYYRRTTKVYPTWFAPHGNAGSALLELGRLEEAERHLRRAIELNPYAGNAYRSLAGLYLRQGRRDEAQRVLQRAAEMQARD